MDLVEFLTTRLDEDEAVARAAAPYRRTMWPAPNGGGAVTEHIARHDPARVLADVAAKRAVLALYRRLSFPDPLRRGPYWDGEREMVTAVVQQLAQPYADHPDYDPAWR